MAFLNAVSKLRHIYCIRDKSGICIIGYCPKGSLPLSKSYQFVLRSTIAADIKDVAATQSPKRDPLDLSFANPEAAFKSKTTLEILRSYIVFQLCSSSYLVNNNAEVST